MNEKIIDQLRSLLAELSRIEAFDDAAIVHQEGAINLLRYLKLRSQDYSKLHQSLQELGLRGFSSIVTDVKSVVEQNLSWLDQTKMAAPLKVDLKQNQLQLLGAPGEDLDTVIMVTLPSAAARDHEFIEGLIMAGMNIARINCAHDEESVWADMVTTVKESASKLNREVKIAMDLAGPKVRTVIGQRHIKPLKMRPQRDESGNVVAPFEIKLGVTPEVGLQVSRESLKNLRKGYKVKYLDARGKKRKLRVAEVSDDGVILSGLKTTYFYSGSELEIGREQVEIISVGVVPHIILNKGDKLHISHRHDSGQNKLAMGSSFPEAIAKLKPGNRIFFDDGKIGGKVIEINEDVLVEITHCSQSGSKLRSDKGINLPDTILPVSGLTTKDLLDLEFVVKHADIVNCSYVNSPEDVEAILSKIDQLSSSSEDLGVVLKIETMQAFEALDKILLAGMRKAKLGVMIARGDLAIEVGWENVVWIAREINAMCHAAGIPIIWATQVLEQMTKKGLPSRAEVIDASVAARVGCVMLNKGEYIIEAINLLHDIVRNFESQGTANTILSQRRGHS